MNHEHGTTYLIAIRQDGHVHERQGGSLVPPVVGVQRTLVIAARCLVIPVIVFHKLGSIVGKRVYHPSCQRIRALAVVFRTLGIELLAKLIARIGIHGIEIAVGIHPAHVVHRSGDGSLDARVDGCRIQRHASPSADAQYPDTVGIHLLAGRKEVHRRTEVLRIDVRRRHITGFTPTLTGVRGVEGNGQESAFGQCHGIQARRLFLHRSERSAHGNGRKFSLGLLGHVHVGRQRNAIAVGKSHFPVVHLVAQREHLVPFMCQIQTLFHLHLRF